MTLTAPQRSAFVDALCSRCLIPCQPDRAKGCVPLSDLRVGQTGRIVGYVGEANDAVSRRLFDLGFAEGVSIELIRRAPLRDPLMFRVAGAEMLLRKREAASLVVELERDEATAA